MTCTRTVSRYTQQRESFVPFIESLPLHCDVYEVKSSVDYREQMVLNELLVNSSSDNAMRCFGLKTDPTFVKNFNKYYADYADNDTIQTQMVKNDFLREFPIPGSKLAARFPFRFFLESNLGQSEIRAMAKKFHAVFIEDLPKLDIQQRNETMRFIILVI